jgi:hypothetical protein
MQIRKLLICTDPSNEIEAALKRMYLRRVQEMFKKTLSSESPFNLFDEVFHGLAHLSNENEILSSDYESLLTITSYYQHSQAGRGSLVAKLLERLGTTEKIEFEYPLLKIPKLLQQNISLTESELTKQKFDIVNKSGENLVLCELKMRVYSGCTAGRIELMEKFNKCTRLIIQDQNFRNCLKNGGIRKVFLVGGVLFDTQGDPATSKKDEQFGICYNGLIRGKDDILHTLRNARVPHNVDDSKAPERAFLIEFTLDGIDVSILAVYGNEVIKSLFVNNQQHDINYFRKQLEDMLYDDLWLGQLITMSERAVLNQNLKKNKKLNNYITSILRNKKTLLPEIAKFRQNRDIHTLKKVTSKTMQLIHQHDMGLLSISPTLAEVIIKSSGVNYSTIDYVADIIQFLSCQEVVNALQLPEDDVIQNT